MPRQARIDIPGLLQHVIVRGVARADIFLDDEDRQEFAQRLGGLLTETETRCYAWALLNNHVHMLLLPTVQPLARLMRRLLTGYAVVFNLRHNRSGHLFQNRYKSIVCDTDSYLLELIRYIHLNPVRAGMVDGREGLSGYPWSGHQQLLGRGSFRMVCAEDVLSLFGKRKKAATTRYLSFLEDGLAQTAKVKLSCGGRHVSQHYNTALADDVSYDERILGGGDFVEKILATAASPSDPGLSLDELIHRVARYSGVSAEDLAYPCRQARISRAKALICYWATRRYRIPGSRVAERLGYTTSAVSLAAKRGQEMVAKDEELQRIFT